MKFDPKFFEGTGTSPEALRAFHPEADRFPMMGNKEFNQLIEDIKKNGLQNPIVLHQEKILDGRNRYLACIKAKVPLKFIEFGGEDPVAFVFSVNAHRRHLKKEQKLDLVAKLLEEFPDRSDRTIADMAQVHHKTVGRVRDALKARGALRHEESRVDSKGRSYPAHKERKTPVSAVSLIEPDDAEPESWVLACADGLRHGDINRKINVLLSILGAAKKQIAVLPKIQREILARGFLALLNIPADNLRPITEVPIIEESAWLSAHADG